MLFLMLLATSTSVASGKFMGAKSKSFDGFSGHRLLNKKDLKAELNAAIGEAMGEGHGVSAERLQEIEAQMRDTFRSLHKNSAGRIQLEALRYLMHRFFTASHGWSINGFEQHGAGEDGGRAATILKKKLPGYVEGVLEARLGEGGFGLADAVTMAAVLERMIFDEGLSLLQVAFKLNDIPTSKFMSESELREVTRSFGLLHVNMEDGAQRTYNRHIMRKAYLIREHSALGWHVWNFTDAETDAAVVKSRQRNPFAAVEREELHTFEDAAEVAVEVQEHFGTFQDEQCSRLREGLVRMDPNATGRIPLKDFAGKRVDDFVFLEPETYLKELGVLDPTADPDKPMVVIPNYVLSLSNCAEVSDFYSVCCLDPCEAVMDQLERKIAAPTASADHIARALDGVTTPSTEEPRNLTDGAPLRRMLDEVESNSEGWRSINLHGRLLAQWLHHAFPHDCPYPAKGGSLKPLTATQYQEQAKQEGREAINYTQASTATQNRRLEKARQASETLEEEDDEIIVDDVAQVVAAEREDMPIIAWTMEEELFTSKIEHGGFNTGKMTFLGFLVVGAVLSVVKTTLAGSKPGGPVSFTGIHYGSSASAYHTAARTTSTTTAAHDENQYGSSWSTMASRRRNQPMTGFDVSV